MRANICIALMLLCVLITPTLAYHEVRQCTMLKTIIDRYNNNTMIVMTRVNPSVTHVPSPDEDYTFNNPWGVTQWEQMVFRYDKTHNYRLTPSEYNEFCPDMTRESYLSDHALENTFYITKYIIPYIWSYSYVSMDPFKMTDQEIIDAVGKNATPHCMTVYLDDVKDSKGVT